MAKHQYDSLPSTEQGDDIEMQRPATPDTLINEDRVATQPNADQSNCTTTDNVKPAPDSGILNLPGHLASVKKVRQYIIDILHGRYDVPLEDAESAASNWRGALGDRFRQTTQDELENILGEEYARMIYEYRELVKADGIRETRDGCIGALGALICFIAFLLCVIWLVKK